MIVSASKPSARPRRIEPRAGGGGDEQHHAVAAHGHALPVVERRQDEGHERACECKRRGEGLRGVAPSPSAERAPHGEGPANRPHGEQQPEAEERQGR
jgi:hypothetical protein